MACDDCIRKSNRGFFWKAAAGVAAMMVVGLTIALATLKPDPPPRESRPLDFSSPSRVADVPPDPLANPPKVQPKPPDPVPQSGSYVRSVPDSPATYPHLTGKPLAEDKEVTVKAHRRKDGTYVPEHTRSKPKPK